MYRLKTYKDEDLVGAFVDRVFLLGIGLRNEDIFCTSIEGIDIKSGKDFRNIIKEKLQAAQMIIQLITENYKRIEVC